MKLKQNLNYSQPTFYKFNEDSITLVKYVQKNFKFFENINVLDLCSGCGVIGLELLYYADVRFKLDLMEKQIEFKVYLNSNKLLLKNNIDDIKIIISDFSSESQRKSSSYDLIVCNPPYFEAGRSRLSANINRNICRHFIDNTYTDLIKAISKLLKLSGTAYIITRQLLEEENKLKLQIVKIKIKRNLYIYIIKHASS